MSIFSNYKPHNFNAYLNWMFDDGNGRLDNPTEQQRAWDFKVLGSSYLQNAELSLATLIAQGNPDGYFDTAVFPILFNIWHGIELLLKSGNTLCDIYLGNPVQDYSKHKIDSYADLFKANMKKLKFKKVEKTHLSEMLEFVDECKQNNANFDFARYTEKSNGSKQFYNTPDDTGYLQNHCVDVIELYVLLKEMNKKFPDCIDYLYDYYQAYGTNTAGLNDTDLQAYTRQGEEFDEKYAGEIVTYKDILEEFVDEKIAEVYPHLIKKKPSSPPTPPVAQAEEKPKEKE